jgi:hypothetical protein
VEEHLFEERAQRVAANPARMTRRKQLAEHLFGTIKRGMTQDYCLLRRWVKMRGEMRLTILADNLKRVMSILGVAKMVAAVTEAQKGSRDSGEPVALAS